MWLELTRNSRSRTTTSRNENTVQVLGYSAMNSQFSSRAALSTLFVFEGFAVGITCLSLYAAIVRHAGWEGAIVGLTLSIAIHMVACLFD
jgi:hypothetical protein